MAAWQNNWMMFGEELQRHIAHGNSHDLISRELAGKQVLWHGVLIKKDLDPNAPMVVFEMEPYYLNFGGEKQASLPNLVIPLYDGAIREWVNVPEGKPVNFRATFVEQDFFLRPFELTTLRSGRITITLRLVNAEFLGDE